MRLVNFSYLSLLFRFDVTITWTLFDSGYSPIRIAAKFIANKFGSQIPTTVFLSSSGLFANSLLTLTF